MTHSSGNHGAALAYAAGRRGISAFVVMPETAPRTKQENVRRRGATIRFCAPTLEARDAACAAIQRETGARLVHPFDDVRVIAGQGTAALELIGESPGLGAIVAPVGGGGLLSGTSIAVKSGDPAVRVFGAEPANADDAARSFRSGSVEPLASTTTIADGLRTTLSPRTLSAIRAHVDAIGTASEAAIVRAMRMIWVEKPRGASRVPSGSACLPDKIEPFVGDRPKVTLAVPVPNPSSRSRRCVVL